ncbi:MAG: PDZ domain-containing protein [Chloroflexi bacterium]|nr:PDZ domain-containing protein [Chloroflexota bacterium]
MRRALTVQTGRHRWLMLACVVAVLGVIVAGCDAPSEPASPRRSGNARVTSSPPNASGQSVGQAGQPGQAGQRPRADTGPGEQDSTLGSGELAAVFQLILLQYIEPVDSAKLVEAANAAILETWGQAGALPIDLAPLAIAPTPAGDPQRDWLGFARGYDAMIGKHPRWAGETRPDWAIIRRMIATLGDTHSVFIEPADVRRMSETGFSGIGVQVSRVGPDEAPYVSEVFASSPAANAGLKPGDRITGVDGNKTEGRSLTEIVSGIRGQQGTPVVLSVARGDQPALDVRIVRGAVEQKPVEASVRGGILGVMRIRSFGDGVPETVQQFLTQGRNRGARAWIIDLRGNSGGALDAMARVAGVFVDNRPVGLAVGRDGQRQALNGQGRSPIGRFPFVLLVDRETSSAAEILAAAIQEYQLGPVVGTRTAGSVAIAAPQPLSDGSAVQITIRRLVTPNGVQIDKRGVTPDVEVDRTVDDLQNGDDPQLLTAIQLLAGGGALPATVPQPPDAQPQPNQPPARQLTTTH